MGQLDLAAETTRCTFCGRKKAREYPCPHDACDGVNLCDRCLPKGRRLLAAANHLGCVRSQHTPAGCSFEGEVGEVSIVETVRRCGQHRIRGAGIFLWTKLL